MKKPLTAALILAGALAVAAPVGAAVPTRPATLTIPCNDGSGKSARVWVKSTDDRLTQLAAKNPCTEWLQLTSSPQYQNGAPSSALQIAPGVHFNWNRKRMAEMQVGFAPHGVELIPAAGCGGPTRVRLVYSYKDVREADGEVC